jgi:feruloyl esterase
MTTIRLLGGLLVAFSTTASTVIVQADAVQAFRPADASGRMACAQVTSLKVPDVRITEAVAVPAATTGAVRVPHCRVNGVISTEITFTLLLPDTWNQKFFMGGGGGFVGTVQNSAAATVNLGYASAGTDTGHKGGITDASWALNNLERRVNFGYLAVHRTADVAKAIIASYYGSESTRNYFSGCSRGGGQGVMEAVRYPDDFDGIVAGAPALDWPGIGAQFIKDAQAAFPDPRNLTTPMFTPDTLKMVGAKILDACDAIDGVKDGVMEDPRRCTFDIGTLPLTDAQKTALKKIYGATTNRDGVIYPAQPYGGEAEAAGWQAWITGVNPQVAQLNQPSLRFGFGTEMFKYLVFNDPSWDYSKYDFSTFKKDTQLAASYLNSNNPDLAAFKAKGHKLILWHGWADAGLSPLATLNYYDEVQSRDADARSFARMFLMPGVLHCSGGVGPDDVDWTTAIADWVERGKAPDQVIASKRGPGGVATRTRPLCAYPQHAEYKGSGSTDEAGNFVCK